MDRAIRGWTLLLVGAAAVQATTLYQVDATGSSVSAHTSGDGLLISTQVLVPDGYSFSLSGVGDTHTFDFFEIWTQETWVNVDEDTVARPISATLAFSAPPSSGTVNGNSVGISAGFAGFYQAGSVTWGGPVLVNAASGQYEITLSDETFDEGWFWTGPGKCGAIVEATIRQVTLVPVPESVQAGAMLLVLMAGYRIFTYLRRPF